MTSRLVHVAAILVLPVTLGAAYPREERAERITAAEAVIAAAGRPAGMSGLFEITVRASGRQDGVLYLNSERDYRDPRNLSIDITRGVEQALEIRLGGPVERVLHGKTITVRGTARKTRVYFGHRGQPTTKYYYQTHLHLRTARDLVVESSPDA